MTRPIDPIPEWATSPDAQIDEPAGGEVANGWRPGDKPPASYVNWFWNRASAWLSYLVGAFETEHNDDGSHGDISAESVTVDPAIGAVYSEPLPYEVSLAPWAGGWAIVGDAEILPSVIRSTSNAALDLYFDVGRLFPERAGGNLVRLTNIRVHYILTGAGSFVVKLLSVPKGTFETPTELVNHPVSGAADTFIDIPIDVEMEPGDTYILAIQLLAAGTPLDRQIGYVGLTYERTRIE